MPNINLQINPQTTFSCSSGGSASKHGEATRLSKLLGSATNSTVRYLIDPVLNTGRGIYRSLHEWSPWHVYRACEQDFELQSVHDKGDELLNRAEAINHSSRTQNEHQTLPLILKGKVGIALGAVLLSGAGCGAGYYFRRNVSDAPTGDFSEDPPGTTASSSSGIPYNASGKTLRDPMTIHLHRHDDAAGGNGSPSRPGFYALPEADNIPANGMPDAGKRKKRHIKIPDTIKEANRKIIWHLYNENYLEEIDVNKTNMLIAASDYLLTVDGFTQEDKFRLLARKVLAAAGLYGGEDHETLSMQQVKAAIRYWFFNNVLGGTPEEVIAKKMAFSKSPTDYTPGKIKKLFSFEMLYSNSSSYVDEVDKKSFDAFNLMWTSLLNEEMRFLRFADALDKGFVLYGEKFASLYAGTKFFEDVEYWSCTAEEAVKAGDVIWNLALNGNITEHQIDYLRVPALFFIAKNSPKKFANEVPIRDLSSAAIMEYIVSRKKNLIISLYNSYLNAVTSWRSKGKLADDFISQCPTAELFALPDIADGIRNEQQRRKNAVPGVKQNYLNGWRKPCKSSPESLSDEYKKITLNVADSFKELDKNLILSAFESLPVVEHDFISSLDAVMFPVAFSMRTSRGTWATYGIATNNDFNVFLKHTDLISVNHLREERIYALKRNNEKHEGYSIIRVDYDIRKYIDSDIFNYNGFGTYYRVDGNKVKCSNDNFEYTIKADRSHVSARDGDIKSLINFLSTLHRDNLYQSLYEMGNDSSDIIKIWNIVKHTIPFYDCAEGIMNNDPVQGVPSCIMDGISSAPAFMLAVDLTGRFGMKLAHAALHGVATVGKAGVISVVKHTLKHVGPPGIAEMTLLGKTALRGIDPGFELLSTASRSFSKRVLALLASDSKTSGLAQKIAPSGVIDSQPLTPPAELIMASIPGTELSITLKRIRHENGRDLYVQFNPETGEAFGIPYYLVGEFFHQAPVKYLDENAYSDSNLEYVINEVPALNLAHLTHLTPDDKGLYSYIDFVTHQKRRALKVKGLFYRIEPGREAWSIRFSDKKNIEVARFDDIYYKINEATRLDVKYQPCRSLRSPTGRCVHLSPMLENAFKENKRFGTPERHLPTLNPAESHPGLYKNPHGKLYIKYEDVFFRLKNEYPKKPDEILSVTGPKSGFIFGKLMKKKIAEVTASRDGGGYYFNTPEENMMECAGTSKAVAELHSAMRRLSFMDHRNFLMPENMRATAIKMDKKVLNDRDYYSDGLEAEEENIVITFRKNTESMLADARNFFLKGTDYLKKGDVPAIALSDEPKYFLSKIYEKNNGIAIGEYHSSIASKKFIIENIDVLHKNGVRTLYLEHLQTDMHQDDLDGFFKTGVMSVRLQNFITELDLMFETDWLGRYTFMTLIKTAQKRKIRITAIDSFVSYYGIPPSSGSTDRVALMNYYSHLLINVNQLHHQSKWIALVGSAHINTFEGVPGLADLNAVVSIRVNDLPADETGGIFKDPGEIYRCSRAHRPRAVQGDLLLEVGVTNARHTMTPPSVITLLKNPGQFIIEKRGVKNFLVYMDRWHNLLHYPIDLTPDNRFYLNTNEERWDIVSRESFERLDEMVRFIENNRVMTLVA